MAAAEPGTRAAQLERLHIDVAGVPCSLLQAGPADAREAVVFVHGIHELGEDWTDLLDRAGELARAVAPDMPGCAGAAVPPGFGYTVADYGEHLGRVLDELGIRRAHLVAHAFGGPWALAWAVRHPDAFASATLIDGGVLVGYDRHRYARLWRTPVVGELVQAATTRPTFRFILARENRRLPPAAIDRIYDHAASWRSRRAALKAYRGAPPAALTNGLDALRALDRPALVLWGTADAYIPWTQAERQRDAFPSARVELLEGLGHWPFLEDPGRVAGLVVPFLRGQIG
jgi:pimeloyl-ACP methyl ester carboxylesterase